MFVQQVEKLWSLPGVSMAIIRKLREASAAYNERPDVLIVLPFNILSFEKQLARVDLGHKKRAYTFLDPSHLSDVGRIKLPEEPYLLLDVEDGTKMLGKSPREATKLLKQERRYPFTVNHGLSLVIHSPEVIFHHNLHLSGSRIKDAQSGKLYVPDFYVYANRLKMKRDEAGDADARWGTPSYRDLVIL